jgi:hypothetical protein
LPEEITPDFFNSFGPFDGIKRDCWEGGVRMPAIAAWPGQIPAHTVVSSPNAIYDWLPTFAGAAGLTAPASADGVSLLPSLTGKGRQQNSLVYIEYFHNGATPEFAEFDPQHRNRKRGQMQLIRFGDTVGIRYNIKSHNDDFEIYNVVKDPQQTKNLASMGGLQTLQQKMKDRVLQVRLPDTAASRPYDDAFVPAVNVGTTRPGLTARVYKGVFPWIPNVTNLSASDSFVIQDVSANTLTGKGAGVVEMRGYINIPEEDEYTFSLTAGSAAILRLHEALVIDEDFGYKAGTEQSGRIRLKKGLHPFRLSAAINKEGEQLPLLQWQTKKMAKQVFPAGLFFRD